MFAHVLEIGDQMLRGVGIAAKIGMAASGAALIDEKDVVPCRIEQCSMQDLRAAAGAAVQEDDGAPTFAAHFFNINPMAIADIEHAGVKGAERFRESLHRPSAEHAFR